MNELPPEEKLIQTEAGMFLMEMEKVENETEDLIAASLISDELKAKCREVIAALKAYALEQVEKNPVSQISPVEQARIAVSQLIDLLPAKDQEAHELFEALKAVILEARASAMNWEWPPKKI